jgi:hypothetical protein
MDKVELADSQLKAITVQTIAEHVFSPQRTAVGSIDFDEDRAVQVFSNYQGKIIQAFAKIGDPVTRGQPLYTIESPDLLQSESALVAAAGVYALTTKVLERDRKLHETKGISDKDLDQATSDQMSADAALKAARCRPCVWQVGRRDRPDGRQPPDRPCADRAQSAHRPGDGPQCAAGPAGPTRQRDRALCGRGPVGHVDGGECRRG